MSLIEICATISIVLVILQMAGVINWNWAIILFPIIFLSALFIVTAIIMTSCKSNK
jgi:membrane protein YdbS with pleckstrin-like domain